MGSSEFEYRPSEVEDEMFLSDVPLSITKHAIESQFTNPLENRKKDYVRSFIDRYNYTIKTLDHDDDLDEKEEADVLYDTFIGFMVGIFEHYLDLGFPEIEDASREDQGELIHLTYRFFIKDAKKNFSNLILNYLNEHKDEIIEDLPEIKDVTSVSFKSETIAEDDIIILSNLERVIYDILAIDFSVDEFMELCQGSSYSLEREFVSNKFDEFEIVGNFYRPYVSMLDSEFRTELQSKVRNKILKNYPKRKREETTEEELENEEYE